MENTIFKDLGGIVFHAKRYFTPPHYARAISVIRLAAIAGRVHHD
jgi:hypothetical protein